MNTQKERFEKTLESKGLYQSDLIRIIYGYEKIKSKKSNFSDKIAGKRMFSQEEILMIEEILGVSIHYLICGSSIENDIELPTYRTTAKEDNASNIDYFISNDIDIRYQDDEYGNTLIELIGDYGAVNCLDYLIDLNEFNMNKLLYDDGTQQFELLEKLLLCVIDKKPDIFSKFYNFELGYGIKISEDRLRIFLEYPESVRILCDARKTKNNNRKELIDCGELIQELFNIAILDGNKYEKSLQVLLEYAVEYNEELYKMYSEILKVDARRLYINENLIYNTNRYDAISRILSYNVNFQPDISFINGNLLNKVDEIINKFGFEKRILRGGFSGREVYVENEIVYKESNENQNMIDCLKLFNDRKFEFIPKYIGRDGKYNKYSFIPGVVGNSNLIYSIEVTFQIIDIIKRMNTISKELLGNRVYVHGDLGPNNVLFKENCVTGIIDWDSTKVGEEHEDLIYVLWTWFNIGLKENRNGEDIFNKVVAAVKRYDGGEEFNKNFADKMIQIMDDKLNRMSKESPDYERIFYWVQWSKTWVVFYKERITKEIG